MSKTQTAIVVLAALLAASIPAQGAPGADPRIREVAFDAGSVVAVSARPGVATLVEFGPGEHVLSVGTGQGADCQRPADPWCVAWPANSGFFYVRPRTRANSSLALAVVTDRHAYSLQFDPLAPNDPRPAVFRLIFTYPPAPAPADTAVAAADSNAQPVALAVPLVTEAEILRERLHSAAVPQNARYSIALGKDSEQLQPAMVFDDGRFTYLRWPGNHEIPAVFEIRADGSETVVNMRMEDDLMVIDRVARAWMLRSGGAVASIRNEGFDAQGTAPVGGTTVPGVERVLTGQAQRGF